MAFAKKPSLQSQGARLRQIRTGLALLAGALIEAWMGFQSRDAECLVVAGSCVRAALELFIPVGMNVAA